MDAGPKSLASPPDKKPLHFGREIEPDSDGAPLRSSHKWLLGGSSFRPEAGRLEGCGDSLRWPMERLKFKSDEDKEWVLGKIAATLFKFPGQPDCCTR